MASKGTRRKSTSRNRLVQRATSAVGTAAVIAAAGVAQATPGTAAEPATVDPVNLAKANVAKALNASTQGTALPALSVAGRSSSSRTVTVQSGDTLSEIAGRHGVSWQSLCKANGLDDCNMIFPGQQLKIGDGASSGGAQDQRNSQRASRSGSRSSASSSGCSDPTSDESWIIQRESSGSVHADNPTSTAFGLGQLLIDNRSYYGSQIGVSPDTTDYCSQLRMFRLYVEDRYGSASAAKSFWLSHNWY